MSWSKREGILGFVCMLLILAAIVLSFKYSSVQDQRDYNMTLARSWAQKNIELTRELDGYRTSYKPLEFTSVEELIYFASHLPKLVSISGSLLWAIEVQDKALLEGRIIGYQVVKNSITGATEFWPSAKIGSELYTIEPILNQVTLYYPAPWWR